MLTSLAVAVLVTALAYAFVHPPDAVTQGKIDLDAFYCAGKTYLAGENPYRYGPMHACETAILPPQIPEAAVPAPFPPYAILLFALISKLSFPDAALLWELLLIVCAFATVVVIVELMQLPLWLVGTCTLIPFLAQTVVYGSLAPIPIALLCCAAIAVRKRHWGLASLSIGLSAIEPHMALPAMIAAFVLLPKIRPSLLCVIAALGILTLVPGPALNVEYFGHVLPAHAASELGTAGQFSLSALLYTMGTSARLALAVGSMQYVAFIAVGLIAARALQREEPAMAILVPMAFATLGGTFVHASQLLAVAPAAWVIAAKARSTAAWAGLVLLLIPWDFIIENAPTDSVIAGTILFTVLVYHRRVGAAALGAIILAALLWLVVRRQPGAAIHAIGVIPPDALTELAWGKLASQAPPTLATLAAHGLTYAGIALVLYAGWSCVSRHHPRSVGWS